MENILIIVGSSIKDGNTDKLVNAFIEGATKAGHTINKVMLKNINGCLGCNQCRVKGNCIQKDDMVKIYPLFSQADIIVLASPLYYWTISAKLKAFIERMYAIAKEDKNPPLGRYEKYPHKESVLLMSAADECFWTFEQAVSYYQFAVVNYIGWKDRGMVLAGNCGGVSSPRSIESTKYLEDAYRLGLNL